MQLARPGSRGPATVPGSFLDLTFLGAGLAAAAVVAMVVSQPGSHSLGPRLAAAAVFVAMLLLPANSFIVTSTLFFALLQLVADRSFSVGPANLFPPDLFVGLITVRALLPRDRRQLTQRLHAFTLSAFGLWATLMVIGILRALSGGTPIDAAVRSGLSLFYWPLLYFGFSRALRERDADYRLLVRALVAIGIGLIAYMFLMRALNRPFEATGQVTGNLGEVVSSTGQVFHRDFGFWSAYIVYPIVALLAVGKLIYTRTHTLAWLVIASVSIIATATTLIRSEIYGLIAGIAVVLLFSRTDIGAHGSLGARRLRALLMLASVIGVAGALVAVANPGFARAVGERSIPKVGQQSAVAKDNAEYRVKALHAGTDIANKHLLGLGVLSTNDVVERGIDPGFLAHSGPAVLLIFTGWPGLIAAVLALVGLVVDSARARSPGSWWHPVLVGVLVMLVGNSFGAVGIVGQEFVIGIAALFIALRFAAAEADPAL